MKDNFIGILTDEDATRLQRIAPRPAPQSKPPMRPGRRLSSEELAEVQEKIAALCLEYNVGISGCGCCGSPVFDYVDTEGAHQYDENYNVGGAREEIPVDD